MPNTPQGISNEDASSRSVARAGWGLLLIWIGTVLFLHWGWGLALIGAGTIVLAAQVWRRQLGLKWERSGIIFGLLLLVCGVWTLFDVAVELVPLLCIAGGIALLVSTWAANRARATGRRADLQAASHPRA
jgi:hypothetical protein